MSLSVPLFSLGNRNDIVIKPADRGVAVVVWDWNMYLAEATSNCLIHMSTNKLIVT